MVFLDGSRVVIGASVGREVGDKLFTGDNDGFRVGCAVVGILVVGVCVGFSVG